MCTDTCRTVAFCGLGIFFLSLLVVAHHWALANGAPGDWYTGLSPLEYRNKYNREMAYV